MAWQLKGNLFEVLEYIIGQTGGNVLVFLGFFCSWKVILPLLIVGLYTVAKVGWFLHLLFLGSLLSCFV